MENFNLVCIPEEIKSEFSVSEDGKTFASRRATARLCGLKSNSPISNLLRSLGDQKHLSDPLQTFIGQDFTGDQKLPDLLVFAIISHYALKGKEQAIKSLLIFGGIGIRTWIQQELNWQAPKLETTISCDDYHYLRSKIVDLEILTKSCTDYFPWEYGKRITALEKKLELQEQELIDIKTEYSWFKKDYDRLKEEHANLVRQREYRQKLNQLVAKFAGDNEGYRKEFWSSLYGKLIAQTGFEVQAAAKLWNCSCLDAVEMKGIMPKLYHIASEFVVVEL